MMEDFNIVASGHKTSSFALSDDRDLPFCADNGQIVPQNMCATTGHSVIQRRTSGPKTVSGKRRSSLNSTRHGLYSESTVVPKLENRAEYESFARTLLADLDLRTALEVAMAERVVSTLWRLRRIRRYETERLGEKAEKADQALTLSRKYQQEADLFTRAASAVMDLAYGYDLSIASSNDIESALSITCDDKNGSFDRFVVAFERLQRKGEPIKSNAARQLIVRIIASQNPTISEALLGTPRERLVQLASVFRGVASNIAPMAHEKARSANKLNVEALVLNYDDAQRVQNLESRLDRQLSRAISDLLVLRPDAANKVTRLRAA